MTKLKILILVLLSLPTIMASAQTDSVYNKFMQQYMSMQMGYRTEDPQSKGGYKFVEQIGTPMPEFYFDKKLNSKALKGHYIVLDFWATWCGGCRVLTHCLDSLMIKGTDLYTQNGVQLIGVDYKETMVDKGYNARKYWKEKGYGFPSVYSKGVQECGDAVHANHPTALVVDDKGIIRYRVDGAGYHTAGQIMFAIWALKFFPESGQSMTMATARQFFDQGETAKGLYVLYHLPTTKEVDLLKFEKALSLNPWTASELFEEIEKKYRSTDDYCSMMTRLAEIVVREKAANMYERTWHILQDFYFHGRFGKESRETVSRLYALLQARYGLSLYRSSLRLLENQLEQVKEDTPIAKQLKADLEQCKEMR